MDASNPLPHGGGTLPPKNEVLGNDSNGAAAQASNLGVLNRAAVDGDNQLANPAHNVVQQGGVGDFDFDNGALLNPFGGPHAAQAVGAGGEENEDLHEPLEDEAEESDDSDQDDYTQFMSAEVLDCLHEYKQAYRITQ